MKTYEVKCKRTTTWSKKKNFLSYDTEDVVDEKNFSIFISANSEDEAKAIVENQIELNKKLCIPSYSPPRSGQVGISVVSTKVEYVLEKTLENTKKD